VPNGQPFAIEVDFLTDGLEVELDLDARTGDVIQRLGS
jgi:uncharacterized membrane protein YkoI